MIINLLEHDKQQRALALDASQSFIVQAPAGSGKTELLIQRFLTLLNHVKTPEEILAITFTKKAANEMRIRIIKALKHAQTDPEPESVHAKQTWNLAKKVLERDEQLNWRLMNNPNQLRVQTIDSLCSFLTRQLPVLSHFGSQPNVADNPAYLHREAVEEVLRHVEENFEWSQAISQLLLHLDNDLNKLHDLIVSLLAKRDQWLPYIHLNTNDTEIKKQLERHLAFVITDSLTALHEIFPKEIAPELIRIVRYAADNLAISKPDSDILACRDLIDLPGTAPQDKKAWLDLATFLLTDKGDWRKSFDARNGMPASSGLKNQNEKMLAAAFKEQITAVMKRLYDNNELRLALSELKHLPRPHYKETQWEILKSLLHVLKIVAAQLRVTFRQYGQIDFIENAQAALAALGNEDCPTNLALALDYQIRHILVDEFQDTSLTQYQLLEKLITGWEATDGRTLFVVGDPMQSIYRFREAEVGLFIRMRRFGIGNIKLAPLTLSVNFRSMPTIIEWNNAHFHHIFPSFNDMTTGAVTYNPSVSAQITGSETGATVEIQGYANAGDQVQAEKIIEIINEAKKQHPNEKIAMLVRSRSHLKEIIPTLKKAGISYHAVEIDLLASRQSIQDLVSLTCALLHPADRISWLAVLRAPWCGLSLADMLVIAGENPYAAILDQLMRADVIQHLSNDGQQRLAKIFPIIKRKIDERQRSNLRTWIESTWLLLGGPACLNDYAEMDDVNAYFKLLENFSQQDHALNPDKLKEKINGLYAAEQSDDDTLQIMTIHSAKGLEFDTVILPHLERKPANDDNSLLLWMERPLINNQIALLLAPIHATGDEKDDIYEYVNRQHSIKSGYEIDRLFYVATTRAKKRLHLFFNVATKEKGDFKIESGSFLKKLWPLIEKDKHQIISFNHAQPYSENQNNKTHRFITRFNLAWKNPIEDTRVTNIASHTIQTGFQLSNNKAKLIGVVTHRVLQQISQLEIAWWQVKNRKQQTNYLSQHLNQLGILPNELEPAVKMTYQAIQNTLNDKRGQWILQAHQDAKSEFAISAVIDGVTEDLIIDRTFVDENGTRWIIDYKTAALSHNDLDIFLANEQKKYREQMQKYHEAMKLIEERPIRLGLYFPALPAWKEW